MGTTIEIKKRDPVEENTKKVKTLEKQVGDLTDKINRSIGEIKRKLDIERLDFIEKEMEEYREEVKEAYNSSSNLERRLEWVINEVMRTEAASDRLMKIIKRKDAEITELREVSAGTRSYHRWKQECLDAEDKHKDAIRKLQKVVGTKNNTITYLQERDSKSSRFVGYTRLKNENKWLLVQVKKKDDETTKLGDQMREYQGLYHVSMDDRTRLNRELSGEKAFVISFQKEANVVFQAWKKITAHYESDDWMQTAADFLERFSKSTSEPHVRSGLLKVLEDENRIIHLAQLITGPITYCKVCEKALDYYCRVCDCCIRCCAKTKEKLCQTKEEEKDV